MSNGFKEYSGGNKDDIFIVQGNPIKGYFYGNGGINTLDLTLFAPEKDSIDVELHVGRVTDYYQHNSFGMSEMNRILVRKGKADRIFTMCDGTNDAKFIDGQGGTNEYVIQIKIHEKDCAYEMQVVIRPNTLVYNRASEGSFHYTVPYGLGSAKVDFMRSNRELNLNNTFTFEYEPTKIRNIDAINERVLNRISHTIYFNFSPMSDK